MGNQFAEMMKEEANVTYTENGMRAQASTLDANLDLFATIGGLRGATPQRCIDLFLEAYSENPLLATKILFYSRDVRGGLGERYPFQVIISYLKKTHPEVIKNNISLFPVYGTFKDLYLLQDSELEEAMYQFIKEQLYKDTENLNKGNLSYISLLAKWLRTPDSASLNTRKAGIQDALKLGYPVKEYKRLLKKLRKAINIVERKMSAKEWSEIDYSSVPSVAMMRYRNAFERNDKDRFDKFNLDVSKGKATINSATLYPMDLVKQYYQKMRETNDYFLSLDQTIENQWNNLTNYITEGTNILCVVDTSGSMTEEFRGKIPICSSVGLGIYFAQRNKGDFHNLMISFSSDPSFIQLRDNYSLLRSITTVLHSDWGFTTNITKTFELILARAVEYHIPKEDMPKAIIIISDMEFDQGTGYAKNFTKYLTEKFEENGYSLPKIIYWNCNSKSSVFHFTKDDDVLCVSGNSASEFNNIISALEKGSGPIDFMLDTVMNNYRYDAITIAE